MPVLSPQYIGTLHTIELGVGSGQYYLLENLNQKQITDVKETKMITGTIGTRIMDVGGIFWQTNISAQAIIFQGISDYYDAFSLIANKWNEVVNFSNSLSLFLPILETASITINEKEVKCEAQFIGDEPNFNAVKVPPLDNFIARTARWYDCELYFDKPGGLQGFDGVVTSASIPVESAEIKFKSQVNKRFFIQATQRPYFSIESYEVSGTFTVITSGEDVTAFNYLLNDGINFFQQPGVLNVTGPKGSPAMVLRIYGIGEIPIGLQSMQTNVTNVIKAGDVIRITCNFTSFTQ
jgi:hypothetical protein